MPADASQSFQLLQKAAEANYVPAMSLLSDAYAEQKTPVSGQRATYWAMKAAEAGDPQGWLVLGFEYDTGKLGGDPPYWHQKAMESYRKAADGGNCLAMMAIGDLYATGSGVRADQAQAQSWHTKAQSCQGGNLAMLQQQVAQYKARAAAAARSRALPRTRRAPGYSEPGASSRNNRAPAQARNADRSGFNQSIVDGLIAGAVIVIALDVLFGSTSSSGSDADAGNAILNGMQQSRCAGQGNKVTFQEGVAVGHRCWGARPVPEHQPPALLQGIAKRLMAMADAFVSGMSPAYAASFPVSRSNRSPCALTGCVNSQQAISVTMFTCRHAS